MAALQVKPTRMELSNLKKKKKVAVRGHKLMKDKRDEMVRRFIIYVRRNKELREQVEEKLGQAMQSFVLGVQAPKLDLVASTDAIELPYGMANTSAELDGAVKQFSELLPLLIELAEVEKICNRLADEIEKTRRRVNALEYVMIPQFDEAIRAITMKLDENERGNLTRLMKTKEMLANK